MNKIKGENQFNLKLRKALLAYIKKNDLYGYIQSKAYKTNVLINRTSCESSFDRMCYLGRGWRIKYSEKFYIDWLEAYEKTYEYNYDDWNYIHEDGYPVRFNQKEKISKREIDYLISEKVSDGKLYGLASVIGISSKDFEKLANDINAEIKQEQRIIEINNRIKKINEIKETLKEIKNNIEKLNGLLGGNDLSKAITYNSLAEIAESQIQTLEEEIKQF